VPERDRERGEGKMRDGVAARARALVLNARRTWGCGSGERGAASVSIHAKGEDGGSWRRRS
jgi:hypothetical protein